MSIKKTLLAAALAAFASMAMPALASAEVTGAHIKSLGDGQHRTFTIEEDTPGLSLVGTDNEGNPLELGCESLHGAGEFDEGGTTGTLTLTLHGCSAFGGAINCTTPGASTGTIETTHLTFHAEPVEGEPGILITSNNGHIASFKCSFLASIAIDGNGLVGTITEPGWTEETEHATISFTQAGGVQDHLTTDTDGTEWDLTTTLNGGEAHTLALEFNATLTFDEEVELEEKVGTHIKSLGDGTQRTFTIEDDEPGGSLVGTDNEGNKLDVNCESLHGDGEFGEGGTTGTLTLTFHECTAFEGAVNCNSAGASSGTVETTHLTFHVEPVEGEPGLLITSTEGHFASFKCTFLASIVVDGNGIVGTITEPGWTEETEHATISFTQAGGVQDHLTTDTNGTEWDLTTTLNGSEAHTAALEGDATLTFDEPVELLDTEG